MERSDPRSLAPSLIVLALTFGAAVPLSRLFSTGGLAPVIVMAGGGAAAVGAATRRLRLGAFTSWLAQAVGLLVFVSWRFVPDTLAGPLPTARSLGTLGEALEVGARIINAETAPVVAHDEVLLFIAVGIWVTAWLIDVSLTTVGNPLLAIASAIPLFAVPGTLLTSTRRVPETIAFVLPAAIAIWAHEQRRRPSWRARPAVLLVIATLVPALVLTPVLPGFGASPILPGSGARRQVFNPFVAIKPALDRDHEALLFTVQTTRPGYHRLTALDRFDGDTWLQAEDQGRIVNVGTDLPPSHHVGEVVEVSELTTIDALGGIWVPLAYDPVQVLVRNRLSARVFPELDDEPRALVVEDGISRGMRISSRSLVPVPRPRDLDAAPSVGSSMGHYLDLPDLPRRIREIAKEVAGDQPTPFRKAIALQRYLRTFTYDEDVAAGHSFSTLLEFLEDVKRGYCEQFAGSMAVLARSLGLPSRVVIGFTAGRRLARNGALTTYAVTSRHAHAWVEIYFSGHGWIAFEPTPRSGFADPPGYSSPDLDSLGSPTGSPTAAASPSASASVRPSASPTRSAAATPGAGSFPVVPLAAVALAAALVAAVVLLAPAWHRRRRGDGVLAGYAELLAWCDAAGLGRRPSETPREHLVRISSVVDPSVVALAEPLDLVLWAEQSQEGLDDQLGMARRRMAGRLGARRRLLAGIRWRLGRTGPSPASSPAAG